MNVDERRLERLHCDFHALSKAISKKTPPSKAPYPEWNDGRSKSLSLKMIVTDVLRKGGRPVLMMDSGLTSTPLLLADDGTVFQDHMLKLAPSDTFVPSDRHLRRRLDTEAICLGGGTCASSPHGKRVVKSGRHTWSLLFRAAVGDVLSEGIAFGVANREGTQTVMLSISGYLLLGEVPENSIVDFSEPPEPLLKDMYHRHRSMTNLIVHVTVDLDEQRLELRICPRGNLHAHDRTVSVDLRVWGRRKDGMGPPWSSARVCTRMGTTSERVALLTHHVPSAP